MLDIIVIFNNNAKTIGNRKKCISCKKEKKFKILIKKYSI